MLRGSVLTLEGDALVCVVRASDSVQRDPLAKAPMAAPGQVIALCLPTGSLLLHSTFPALQPASCGSKPSARSLIATVFQQLVCVRHTIMKILHVTTTGLACPHTTSAVDAEKLLAIMQRCLGDARCNSCLWSCRPDGCRCSLPCLSTVQCSTWKLYSQRIVSDFATLPGEHDRFGLYLWPLRLKRKKRLAT